MRPVASVVLQKSVLLPFLFNIFVSDLDEKLKCTHSKFADYVKLEGVVDTTEICAAVQ